MTNPSESKLKKKRNRPQRQRLAVDQHVNFSPKIVDAAINDGKIVWTKSAAKDIRIEDGAFKCDLCKLTFESKSDQENHLIQAEHQHKWLLHELTNSRSELIKNKDDITISSEFDEEDGIVRFTTEQKLVTKVKFTLTHNGSSGVIHLQQCEFLTQNATRKTDMLYTHNIPNKGTLGLGPGDQFTVIVSVTAQCIGCHYTPIVFLFSKESEPDRNIHIVRYLSSRCTNNITKDLQPTSRYRPPPKLAINKDVKKVEEGYRLPNFEKQHLEKELDLHPSYIPDTVRSFVNRGMKNELEDSQKQLWSVLESPLSAENHANKLSMLLHIEETQMEVDIRKYDMQGVSMGKCKENARLLTLHVPGLAESRPSVLKGDSLYVRRVKSDGKPESTEYKGYVHDLRQTDLWLGFSENLRNNIYTVGMKFDVRFTISRLPLMHQHRAVKLSSGHHSLSHFLFPTPGTVCQKGNTLPLDTQIRLFDEKLSRNPQQKSAVQHIVCGTSRPAPYIVFGPPGTGKTVTMVEAIKQVLVHIKSSHILACAPSNGAADLLAQRLLNHVDKNKIYRLNAVSRSHSSLPNEIRGVSNWNGTFFEFPNKSELEKYGVIVCTMVTAGRLASAKFPSKHFTHIFLDESGHSVEPEALVSIAGILQSKNLADGGQVVLAGDPKQLGPILRSPVAIQFGLGKSLLERLMENPVYRRSTGNGNDQPPLQQTTKSTNKIKSPQQGEVEPVVVYERNQNNKDNQNDHGNNLGRYNEKLVTKLVQNYRSHPSILKLPNEMFYDNDLEPHADRLVRERLCRWEELPKKGFPLIFHGIMGQDQREERSPSFFNPEEIGVVISYVEKLLTTRGIKIEQNQIGIISPYRKQVQKLKMVLKKKNWNNIEVGSTEEFQGQEKLIIIVSTVRSNPEFISLDSQFNLGFLRNPKRFNVAVTRAKALLVVVGNPYYMSVDTHWNSLLQYCIQNNAYLDNGCQYTSNRQGPDVEELLAKFKNCSLDKIAGTGHGEMKYSFTLVGFDLETTGLVKPIGITQLAAQAETGKSYDTFVIPPKPIEDMASKITGISLQDGKLYFQGKEVQTTPVNETLKNFINFLRKIHNPILVAHNGLRYDMPIIMEWLKKADLDKDFQMTCPQFLDSLVLFRKYKPGLPKYSQEKLVKQFVPEYGDYQAHSATGDVKALLKLIETIPRSDLQAYFSDITEVSY